jgi:CTP synthase (UTP-ammonia lyase)
MHSAIRVGLLGEFNPQQKAHHAIPRALAAASEDGVETTWVSTDSVEKGASLAQFDGLWCVPGMPYRSADGAISAIRFARTSHLPFLGTSAGFQYALIEYARHVLGLAEADHQRIDPQAAIPLIVPLGCALAGVKARVRFVGGSLLRNAYRAAESTEEYHCSFGLNGRYRRLIESGPLYVSALDDQDEIRAVEMDGHPFFVATLFQPEMAAAPNPLVGAFVAACRRRASALSQVASLAPSGSMGR